MLHTLPHEIIREIASFAQSSTDKSALCRLSRLLNAIATPVLWRHLQLDDAATVLGCLRSMHKDQRRPGFVRSLSIEIYSECVDPKRHSDLYLPSDFLFPLESLLRLMSGLEHFTLRVPGFTDRWLTLFATLFLPSLRTFSLAHTGTFSPILAHFLNRHAANLTHLTLPRPWTPAPPKPHRHPTIYMRAGHRVYSSFCRHGPPPHFRCLDDAAIHLHLPHLCSFSGCALYAQQLVVTSPSLTSVELWDVPINLDLEPLMEALGNSSSKTRPFALTVLWDGPQAAVFAPIAQYIPHVRALSVGPFVGPPRTLTKTSVREIGAAFEKLEALDNFSFDNAVTNDSDLSESEQNDLEHDFATLKFWSERCPSLMTSQLHCRTWSRMSGKWVPLLDQEW